MKTSSFMMVPPEVAMLILVELMSVELGIMFVVTITVEASIGSHEYALISFKFKASVEVEAR